MKDKTILRYSAIICTAIMPTSVVAQNQTTENSSDAGLSGDVAIADIVVTAQRRSERLQDVPVAVTAVNAARLDAVGIQNTLDLSKVTPGLTFAQTSGFGQPHIRGVGSSTNGPGLEQPVATYIDGVYIASAPSSLLTLNNVERIEVLKGPQGTLFGRNATGGLIQVVTRDPKTTFSGAANISYANYQDVVGDVYVTGGLSNNLAADIAVRYETQGKGWGRNFGTGNESGKLNHDFAGRAKLLWEPSAETQVRLAFDYENRSSSREAQRIDSQYPGTFDNIAFGGPFPQGGVHDKNSNLDEVFKLKAGGVSAQINQTLGGVELQSITAYRESAYSFPIDVDETPVPIIQINPLRSTGKQFSQELQLSPSDKGRLKWVAGLFYFGSNDQYNPGVVSFAPTPISPVPGAAVEQSTRDRQLTRSFAAYAQATYEVLPDTNLTMGGRYTYERKKIDGFSDLSVNGVHFSTTPIITPASGIPTKVHFQRFSYRVALDHKFGRDILGYVSYNTGFKSGGYNLGSPDNPPYRPETIGALEGGIKSEFFDRHLRLNMSAFRYMYTNIQVGRYVGGNIFLYNGAKAENYGADLDAELVVANGLNLTAGLSYLHARFNSFPNADFIAPIPNLPPNFGTTVPGSADGKRLPFSPTFTVNLGANYKVVTTVGDFAFNANYYRTSKYYAAPDNVLFQKAYGLVDLSLGWTAPKGEFSVKGFVRNVADTEYKTTMIETTAGPVVTYGAPRTYGVALGYKF